MILLLAIKTIIKASPNEYIAAYENVYFSMKYIDKYHQLFKKRQEQGAILENCKFESKTWMLRTGMKVTATYFELDEISFIKQARCRNFKFTYEELIIALKSFILYSLDKYYHYTLKHFYLGFKTIVNETNYFSIEKLNDFNNRHIKDDSYLESQSVLLQFLSYFENFNIDERYYYVMEQHYFKLINLLKENNKRRDLPSFETVFKFNDLIEDFIQIASIKEREKYYPIILWWKITSIIPLRTGEFTVIPYDCISEENGSYFLILRRSSLKGRSSNRVVENHTLEFCYSKQRIRINKEIFDLIAEYKKIVDHYDFLENFYGEDLNEQKRRDFLLSRRSAITFFKSRNTVSQAYILDYFNSRQLYDLLNYFFEEIVYGKYGLNVVEKSKSTLIGNDLNKIQIMDTRHFAMMNMAFLNIDPYIIKELAGHESICSAYHYIGHLKVFSKCLSLSIAKQIAKQQKNIISNEERNRIMNFDLHDLSNGHLRYKKINDDEYINSLNNQKEVDGGKCTYTRNDYEPCKARNGIHAGCIYFIPDEEGLEKINNKYHENNDIIDAEVETLKWLYKYHKKIKEVHERYSVSLNKVHSLVHENAQILSDYVINGVDNNSN